MLDIKFIRENPDAVKENIRKKFQNAKLPLVDEVIALSLIHILPILRPTLTVVEELDETERGSGGFGSTGR